ncbi:MAG TPA: aminotransferase class V-fold PLP-dependent enzyme [Silvibacterium sp.]|nr:aminotransferase class V-fold PLP-dependent enzyme [Silvibacterium sp.]
MGRAIQSDKSFRSLAHRVADFSADYIESLSSVPSYPADVSGAGLEQIFAQDLPREGIGPEAFDLLTRVFQYSRPASPRFFGYVFGSGEPVGVLGDFASSVLHQNATSWRSAPSATTIERTVVKWLAEAVGCSGFSGSLTVGGSSANLMGLCMAREAKVPANERGVRGGVIYCSAEAHMSIQKAAALLGLGHQAVRLIPVDENFNMRTEALQAAIREDVKRELKPIAVVASAGTTATGSIDPIAAIADICEQYKLWLHVDGAYGALACLAIPEAFQGLDRANSLSLDGHKWLYQPTGCGCLLYRNPEDARRAFSHSGEYARSLSDDPVEGFAFFEESIELSRPFRALKLWLSLRYHGVNVFAESIREDLRLAQVLAKCVDADFRLERLAPVALSAVCFRYTEAAGDLNELNRKILDRVVRRRRVYLSNAMLNGQFALRACIVNHRSTEEDVRAIVAEVIASAEEVSRNPAVAT